MISKFIRSSSGIARGLCLRRDILHPLKKFQLASIVRRLLQVCLGCCYDSRKPEDVVIESKSDH